MSKELTEQQRTFITKFVTGRSRGETKKITEAYLDFDRRKTKVEAELAKLEPSHPQMQPLKQQVRDADNKAKKGQFKAAYKDLETTKAAAKGVAKGYVAGLSPQQIGAEIDQLGTGVDTILAGRTLVRTGMNALIADVTAYPKLSDANSLDEALEARRALTEQEAQWRGTISGFQGAVTAMAGSAGALSVEQALKTLAHRVNTITTEGSSDQKKQAGALVPKMVELNLKAKVKGKFLTDDLLRQEFKEQVWLFEDLLAEAKNLSSFQGSRDPEPALATFKALDKAEEERLAKAKERYRLESSMDTRLGGRQPLVPPKQPSAADDDEEDSGPTVLRQFSVDDVLDDDEFDVDDAAIDDPKIKACQDKAEAKLAAFIQSEPPNSDKLFDLLLKAEEDLKADVAASMGLSRTGDDWSPERKKLIEGIAAKLHETTLRNSPNKMADDGSEITVGGVKHTNPEEIGRGGVGKITRYTDAATGGNVVVKSLLSKDPADRKEMVDEMRVHRQIMGGENGQPHPNVVAMKGAAVSEDGSLHMLMDEAGGGDLSQYANALNEMERAGVVPPAARTALTQAALRQAARGLKAVHEQGALHLDLKGANCLMDADGTVKMSDFGSSKMVPEGESVPSKTIVTTTAFAPPESDINQKSEIFWLGSMIQGLSSDTMEVGQNVRSGGHVGDYVNLRTDNRAGALDRLRNAMLDPDPAKRPTLDGVLLSSYLNDAAANYTDEDLKALSTAVATYNKAVGKKIADLTKDMNWCRAEIAKARPAANASRADQEKFAATEARHLAEVDLYQQQLDALNADPAVQSLLAEIQKASAPFQ